MTNGIIINPTPPKYAEIPIPSPLNWVGYSSPANGYIIKNEADIKDFETKNNTKVVPTSSKKQF